MNKKTFLEKLVNMKESEFDSLSEADRALTQILNGITEALQKEGEVSFVGFGKFEVKERKARQGRHPRTGEPMPIPASKNVSFSAGKSLKDSVA